MFTLREICLKRARESQKCQAEINKWYVLVSQFNGKSPKLDRGFRLHKHNQEQIQNPLKTLKNKTLIKIFSFTVKVTMFNLFCH